MVPIICMLWVERCSSKMLKSESPVVMPVTLFWNRVFVDIIKLRWGHQCEPWFSMSNGLFRGGTYCVMTDRVQRWSCRPRNAGDQQPLPDAGKRQERTLPRASEGAWLCGHLDFGPPASSTMREPISVVWATQFTVICYRVSKSFWRKT